MQNVAKMRLQLKLSRPSILCRHISGLLQADPTALRKTTLTLACKSPQKKEKCDSGRKM